MAKVVEDVPDDVLRHLAREGETVDNAKKWLSRLGQKQAKILLEFWECNRRGQIFDGGNYYPPRVGYDRIGKLKLLGLGDYLFHRLWQVA